MVERKAKKSPNGQAQLEAAETAVKMARQVAKTAKAKVQALKSALKAARKRHKRLRKNMRAAKKTLDQVNKRSTVSAAAPATKKKSSAAKRKAAAPAKRRKRSAARKQATKKGSAVPSIKPIALALRKNPRPAARPLSEALPLPQPADPTVDVLKTDFPSNTSTVN